MHNVGYANTALQKGNRMVGASFHQIGESGGKGIWLSQLKIEGYLDSQKVKDNGGCKGLFTITILNANGGIATDSDGNDKVYGYYHSYKTGAWKNDAGWFNEGTQEDIVEGEESDVWIPAGTGLWFNSAAKFFTDDGKGGYLEKYNLGSAGEAIIESQDIELRKGNIGIGIPCSRNVMVSSLGIDGYIASQKVKDNGGCKGLFTITILNANGGIATDGEGNDKVYGYYHSYKTGAWKNDAGWFNEGTQEDIIEGEDTDVELKLGEGLWFNTAAKFYTDDGKGGYVEKYYLTFPGMDE